jgi:lipoyl(octanoyl) transferase
VEPVVRLLPNADADGQTNMAADETLVRSAADGIASLRFYGWTPATLSLGYFQSSAVRHADSRLARLPFVRRPSGGATLVHHHEVTYALALPAGSPWQWGESWLLRMHRIIATGLADLGLAEKVAFVGDEPIKYGDVLCFQQFTQGDVLCGGNKVVGSAQRKYRQALMQHGSILLARSEHTPDLPGIRELTDVTLEPAAVGAVICKAFAEATGWCVEESAWAESEKKTITELAIEKYGTSAWNEKR